MKRNQLIVHVPNVIANANDSSNFINSCTHFCLVNHLDFVVTIDEDVVRGLTNFPFNTTTELFMIADQFILNRKDGKKEYLKNRFGKRGIIKEKKMTFIQKLKFLFS